MKLAVVMTAGALVAVASSSVVVGQAQDSQRAPCANFTGPGRIPYCGGKPAIYAIVDTATFEPSASRAERIRVTGVFIVPRAMSSGLHMPPKRGEIYFSLVPGAESRTRSDWTALAAAAGTGQVVGFAEYWVSRPVGNHPR
ncbi:MAG: hypothetical protein ACRD2X_08550, partial [Vicinamibacteraceae bacterium]